MPGPTSSNAVTAAVVRKKGGPFTIEKLRMGEPRADEVLVRIVATGMCHTDMIMRDQVYPVPLPIVLGHEGAGVVESVGPGVRKVEPGDHVVLSFMSCGHCARCAAGQPNLLRQRSTAIFRRRARRTARPQRREDHAGLVHDHFFGQSSFCTYALANERSGRQSAEGRAAGTARAARLRHSDRRRLGDERAESRSRPKLRRLRLRRGRA